MADNSTPESDRIFLDQPRRWLALYRVLLYFFFCPSPDHVSSLNSVYTRSQPHRQKILFPICVNDAGWEQYFIIDFFIVDIAGITAFVAAQRLSEDKRGLIWNIE